MQENQSQDALLEVFNFTGENLAVFNGKSKNSQIYTPDPKKGKAGVYDAIIRFIPWHKDPDNSIIKKSFFWLEDPETKNGFYADCPSNIGEPSLLWNLYWKFKKSESITEQAKAEKFKRKENYYSIVQIVKDENNPDLNGKLMIFKFGYKIYQMIEGVLKPKFGEPKKPFDLMNAPLFGLSVKIVHGWNNYDDSKFIEKTEGPIFIDGKKMTPKDGPQIIEYLKTSPDLSASGHQPWSKDTEEKVAKIVNYYTRTDNKTMPTSQPISSTPSQVASQPIVTQQPSQTSIPSQTVTSQPIEYNVSDLSQSTEETSEQGGGDDALAALYNNL